MVRIRHGGVDGGGASPKQRSLAVSSLVDTSQKDPLLDSGIERYYNPSMMNKETKMIRDTVYVSPFFGHVCRIPAAAVKTYIERDAALTKLRELGGIHAAPSPAVLKLRAKMLSCKRKIHREGWYSVIL